MGIQPVFKSAFPNDRPNANPNPNGGGSNNNNNNNNNNNTTGNPVYVALDKNVQGQTTAYFAVPQTQNALGVLRVVQRVEFCFSSARNQCSAEFGGSRQAQIISNSGQFYSSVFSIQPTNQTFIHVGIFYADSPNNGIIKSFQFVRC